MLKISWQELPLYELGVPEMSYLGLVRQLCPSFELKMNHYGIFQEEISEIEKLLRNVRTSLEVDERNVVKDESTISEYQSCLEENRQLKRQAAQLQAEFELVNKQIL